MVESGVVVVVVVARLVVMVGCRMSVESLIGVVLIEEECLAGFQGV